MPTIINTALSGSVDTLAVRAATRVARLVSKARAINRDLILTLRGDFKAMPDYLRWHRSVWMGRARLVKREWLEGAIAAEAGGAQRPQPGLGRVPPVARQSAVIGPFGRSSTEV